MIKTTSRYATSDVEFIQLTQNGDQLPYVIYDFGNLGKVTYDIHIYTQGERLDQIAYHYYKKPSLWYLIAEYNPSIPDFLNIKPGTELIIPHV